MSGSDAKISELPPLATANDNDLLVIDDMTTGPGPDTKSITFANLVLSFDFDSTYLRLDGTNEMLATLDMNKNNIEDLNAIVFRTDDMGVEPPSTVGYISLEDELMEFNVPSGKRYDFYFNGMDGIELRDDSFQIYNKYIRFAPLTTDPANPGNPPEFGQFYTKADGTTSNTELFYRNEVNTLQLTGEETTYVRSFQTFSTSFEDDQIPRYDGTKGNIIRNTQIMITNEGPNANVLTFPTTDGENRISPNANDFLFRINDEDDTIADGSFVYRFDDQERYRLARDLASYKVPLDMESNYILFTEIADPATPAVNKGQLYAKEGPSSNVSELFWQNETGTPVQITGPGGLGAFLPLAGNAGNPMTGIIDLGQNDLINAKSILIKPILVPSQALLTLQRGVNSLNDDSEFAQIRGETEVLSTTIDQWANFGFFINTATPKTGRIDFRVLNGDESTPTSPIISLKGAPLTADQTIDVFGVINNATTISFDPGGLAEPTSGVYINYDENEMMNLQVATSGQFRLMFEAGSSYVFTNGLATFGNNNVSGLAVLQFTDQATQTGFPLAGKLYTKNFSGLNSHLYFRNNDTEFDIIDSITGAPFLPLAGNVGNPMTGSIDMGVQGLIDVLSIAMKNQGSGGDPVLSSSSSNQTLSLLGNLQINTGFGEFTDIVTSPGDPNAGALRVYVKQFDSEAVLLNRIPASQERAFLLIDESKIDDGTPQVKDNALLRFANTKGNLLEETQIEITGIGANANILTFITTDGDDKISPDTNDLLFRIDHVTATQPKGVFKYRIDGDEKYRLAENLATYDVTLSMGNNKITNVTDPTAPQDAATMNYVDTEIANNIFSGNLSDLTIDVAKDWANQQIKNLADPTLAQDAATMNYVDTELGNYLPLAGGTMVNPGGGGTGINLNNNTMQNIGILYFQENTTNPIDNEDPQIYHFNNSLVLNAPAGHTLDIGFGFAPQYVFTNLAFEMNANAALPGGGVLSQLKRILDNDGETILEFDADSAPVNYVAISNADTTQDPSIFVKGEDMNISLRLYAEGTGTIQVESPLDMTNNLVNNVTRMQVLEQSLVDPGATDIDWDGPEYVDINSDTTITFNSPSLNLAPGKHKVFRLFNTELTGGNTVNWPTGWIFCDEGEMTQDAIGAQEYMLVEAFCYGSTDADVICFVHENLT